MPDIETEKLRKTSYKKSRGKGKKYLVGWWISEDMRNSPDQKSRAGCFWIAIKNGVSK